MSTVAEKNVFVNPFYQEGIGRRTGIQLKKAVRKDSDGFENFDDYWSESENESILDKTANANKENVATRANEAEGKPTPRRKKSSLKSMPSFSPPVASSDREKTLTSESRDVQETSVAVGDASVNEADVTGSVIKGPASTLEPSSAIAKFKTKKRLSFSGQEEAASDSVESSEKENDQGTDQGSEQGTDSGDDPRGSSSDSTIKPDSSQSDLTEDEKTSDSETEQKHDGKSQMEKDQMERDAEETPKATLKKSKIPLAKNTTLKADKVPSSSQQAASPRRTRRSVKNDTNQNKPLEKSVVERSSEGSGGESVSSDLKKPVAEVMPRRSTRQSIKDKSLHTSVVVEQNSSSSQPEKPAPEDQRRKSSRQSSKNAIKVDEVEVRGTRRSTRNAVKDDDFPEPEGAKIDDNASKSNQDSSQETSRVDEKDVGEVKPLKSMRQSDAVEEMTREEAETCDEKVDATNEAPAEDASDKDVNSEDVTKRLVTDNSEVENIDIETGNEAPSSQELPEDASDPNNDSDAFFLSLRTTKNMIRSGMKSIELDDEEDFEIGDVDTQEWGIKNDSSSDADKAGKGKKGRQQKGDEKNTRRQGDKSVKGMNDEENKPNRRKSRKGKSMKLDEDLGEEIGGEVKKKHSKKQPTVDESEDESDATTKEHKGKQRRNRSDGNAGKNKRKSGMGERASDKEEIPDEDDTEVSENPAKMGKTRASRRKLDDQRKKSGSKTKGSKRKTSDGKGSGDDGDSYGGMKRTERQARKRASDIRDDHPDEMASGNPAGAPEGKRNSTRSASQSSATSETESERDAAKNKKGKGKQKDKRNKAKRRHSKKSASQQSDVDMEDHQEDEMPNTEEDMDAEDDISRSSKQGKDQGAKRSRSLSRKSSRSNVHFGTRTRISDAGDTSVHQLVSSEEGEAENAHSKQKIPLTPGVVLGKKGRKLRQIQTSSSDRTSESEKETDNPETTPSTLKKKKIVSKKKEQALKRKSPVLSSQTSSTEDDSGPSVAKSRKTSRPKTGASTSLPGRGSDSRDATSAEEQAVDAVIDFLDSYDKGADLGGDTTKQITPATTHSTQQEETAVTPVSILKTGGKRSAKFKNRKKFSFFFTEVATNKAYIIEPQLEDGVRRTKRHRVRPLEYWRNERPLYERRKSGGFALTGVLSPEVNDESKRQRPKKPAKVKGQLPQTPKNISMHVTPPHGTQTVEDTSVTVVNPESSEEVVVDAVATSKVLKYMGPGGVPAEPEDAITISKALSQKAFSAGVLTIRPLQEKGSQLVRRDTMVFNVVRGKVAVTVHQTVRILQNGDFFFVPKGNVYNIKNLRKDEAKLTFFQHKGQ